MATCVLCETAPATLDVSCKSAIKGHLERRSDGSSQHYGDWRDHRYAVCVECAWKHRDTDVEKTRGVGERLLLWLGVPFVLAFFPGLGALAVFGGWRMLADPSMATEAYVLLIGGGLVLVASVAVEGYFIVSIVRDERALRRRLAEGDVPEIVSWQIAVHAARRDRVLGGREVFDLPRYKELTRVINW
jgi:hypothetical protein